MEIMEDESKLNRVDYLPPCAERQLDLSSSIRTFHIKVSNIDGLSQDLASENYHIQAILFDQKYGHFVGNCWKGKPVKNDSTQMFFNQNFYFYTSISTQDLLVVIELVESSKISKNVKTCGWMCLPLLKNGENDADDESEIHYKVPLVHGSPISLIVNTKLVKKKKKKKKDEPILKPTGMEISLSRAPCPALVQMIHLIPENVMIDASNEIPGLIPSSSKNIIDSSNPLKPRLQKCITFVLERLCIRTHSSHQEVENEIKELFCKYQETIPNSKEKKSKSKTSQFLSSKASVVQRKLQVSIYNGYSFIQDPDIYHLHVEPPATPTLSKNLRRASSMGMLSDSKEECLVLRSDIKLSKVPDDNNITIIFLLEYVISLPSAKEDKEHMPSPLSKTPTSSVSVAWGFCSLGSLKENPAQSIILTCDPSYSPHKILFLKTAHKFELTFSAFSLLKQSKNPTASFASDDQSSIMNDSDPSETSTKTSYFQPVLGHSTPKHKSVSDIPMTVQQSKIDYPQRVVTNPGTSRKENRFALQEVTLVPSSLPLVPPMLHSFPLEPGESFKTFTKLYWDKLQPVLDHSGKPATVIDSSVLYKINRDKELHCPPQKNECMMQFLAMSGLSDLVEVPPEVFFTFQFYRFLPIRTECMFLKQLSENGNDGVFPKSSLVYAFLKTPDRDRVPGFQIAYNIDPTELNKGEYRSFLNYLMKQTLHIDLWNGKSLLYIGTVSLPLKYFCRQGREAVISSLELDIFNCEYPDESLGQVSAPANASLGKLHVRVACIRHPLSSKALENFNEKEETSSLVFTSSRAEEPSTGKIPHVVSKAKRLADTNRELSHLLSTRSFSDDSKTMSPNPQLTEERRRKLARMEAVRNLENEDVIRSTDDGMQSFFKERQRDLLSIETYIQKNKSELIQCLLQKSVTSDKRIYPLVGTKTFFEFVIENPFSVPKKVEITWKCLDLNLVADSKEWEVLRTMNGISHKVNPLSFDESSQNIPVVQLQPNEKVHIPFTYECLSVQANQSDLFKAVSGHHFTAEVLASVPALNSLDTSIKVRFMTEDQTLLAVLNLTVQPLPPSFSHIFKFLSMEHSMFKKSIQINKDINTNEKLTVKCTNSEVVCSFQDNQNWDENINLKIKAPTRAAGRYTEFYVFLYKDKYQIAPFQSWNVCVYPLQRIDLSCVAGQLMRSSLLIRGTHATNLVRCCSNSKDLQLHPSEPFVLSPFAVQELSMNIRSLLPGIKYFQITMVNQALEQVLQSWLLVLSCQKPSISKAFQVHLSIGKETAKRITYTNPYPQDRRFVLHCSHPHLLQLRESEFIVEAGRPYLMGLYFLPQHFIFTETVFLYLNDALADKNEEAYCIKVVCQ